jgi:hypothetical protein
VEEWIEILRISIYFYWKFPEFLWMFFCYDWKQHFDSNIFSKQLILNQKKWGKFIFYTILLEKFDTKSPLNFLLSICQTISLITSFRLYGEWSRDRISGDRNWHFSTFCKIDQEIENALGALGALGDHYFRLFSKT